MTDRFNTLTVVLDRDMREDDAEVLLSAIRQLRGVISVSGNVADVSEYMAEERALHTLRQKVMDVLYPKKST